MCRWRFIHDTLGLASEYTAWDEFLSMTAGGIGGIYFGIFGIFIGVGFF